MFETTWQIPCATGNCVARKIGILKTLSFTRICTNLAHFDIPALIAIIIIILNNTTVLHVTKRRLEACTSKTVCCTTVKVCDHVDPVYGYISILSTRPTGKRTTFDCRQGEGDPSVQLYSGSVLVSNIDGTFSQCSCDAQY